MGDTLRSTRLDPFPYESYGLSKTQGNYLKKVLRVDNFDSEKSKLLTKITRVTEYGIPPSLIINWDQTGLHVVLVSQ